MCSYGLRRLVQEVNRSLMLAGCFACGVMLPTAAMAQTPAPEPLDCAVAAQSVTQAISSDSLMRRLGDLLACPESGPPVIAKLWERPPGQPELLNTLSHASAGLRDMRVLAAVIRTAENPELARITRLAAFRTLVRLYDPSLEVDFRTRPEDGPSGPIFVMMGKWTSDLGRDGSKPITDAGRNELLGSLKRVGDSDEDAELRRVVKRLRKELEKA